MPDFIRPAPDENNPESAQRQQNQKLSRVMNDLLRRGDIFRDEVGNFKIRDDGGDSAGLGTFLELDDSWFTNDSEDTTISDYNIRYDDLGGYSGEPGADALVAPLAGWYYMSCKARFDGMDGLISISLVLNGTTVLVKDSLTTGNIDAFLNTGTAYYLDVGDAITLVIRQETGSFQQPDLFHLNFVFLGADALGTRVTLTASQAILNSTSNQFLSGFTVQRDDLGAYSAAQPRRLTAPADGWYLISVRTVLSTAVATLFLTGFRRSGTLFMGEASTASRSATCDCWYQTAYYLTAGQYVEVPVNQISSPAGTKNITEAQFGMVQLKGDAGVAGVGTPRGLNLTLTSNQSITGLGDDQRIDTYTTVNHDDLIGYDVGTPYRVTIPRSGWHVITGTIRFNSLVSCRVTLSVVLNGATTLAQYTAGTVTQLNNPITVSYYLYAGDYLELYAAQNSGSPVNATSAFFTVQYVGASTSLSNETNTQSLAMKVIESLLDGGFIVQTGVGVWEFADFGYVVGPASSLDQTLAIFDGVTGKLLANVATILADSANGGLSSQGGTTGWLLDGASGTLRLIASFGGGTFRPISFSGGVALNSNLSLDAPHTYSGVGSGLTALNASNLSTGTAALARGGSGADLSATGPGVLYQATSGAVFTAVQSITGAYTVIAGATSSVPLKVKSHASGAAADLFQLVRGSDSAVGVRAPNEFSWQVRTNLIIGGSSSTADDGNLRLWFYNGATQKILWGSIGGTISILVASDVHFLWDSGTSISATPNVGLLPDSAGVLRVTNGSTGRGGLLAATAAVWAGGSTTNARVGGSLFIHFADQGNGTTVETDLYSDTTSASTFGANGDRLEAEYGGLFVSSATATRQIKLYFGGTAIFDSGALTLSLSSAWTMYVTITRVSATVVRYMISMTTEGAALAAYTSVGELTGLTLSSTNVLKITGQAGGVGAASGDITAKLGSVDWCSAP